MKQRLFIILFLSLIYMCGGGSEGKPIDYTTMMQNRLKSDYLTSIDRLLNAQIYVESRGNHLAVSPFGDYGILQIRQVRLDDYYHKTGIRYSLKDCFNPEVSKEIWIFYAEKIGTTPDKWQTIARAWAGGLSMANNKCTLDYWNKTKNQLNKAL